MTITLQAPRYAERLTAPTSKSAAHRALIAAAFADRKTTMTLRTSCEDIDATVRCLSALGAVITTTKNRLDITPIIPHNVTQNAVLDCGESGSTLRFLLPVCAALGANATFVRHGRLPERPLSPLKELLEEHGLRITENGKMLLTEGKITAGEYRIAANVSSQYVTGLLFALSLLETPSTLALTGNVESAPYIDMTVDMLTRFKAPVTVTENGTVFYIPGRKSAPMLSSGACTPEGDFSSAAFPLAMGAIGTHPVTVTGLSPDTLQGDRAILELLRRFGADVKETPCGITVSPAPLYGIEIDAAQIPDLVPVLAVVACAASGTTRIKNAARLRLKESDRLSAVTSFLRTLGGDITEAHDGLIINGGKPLSGGTVDVCGDHRIAMSAAVAALLTKKAVIIPHVECVNKSYPTFFKEAVLLTDKE